VDTSFTALRRSYLGLNAGFTEERRQSQVPEEIKKQFHIRTISSSKPKTQWFCVQICNNTQSVETNKTKCRCFLMSVEWCERHIAGLTKRFGYFGAPK